jgi:hypothetical protein
MTHSTNRRSARCEDVNQGSAAKAAPAQPLSFAPSAGARRPLRLRHGHIQFLGRDVSSSMILLLLAEFLILMGALYLAALPAVQGLFSTSEAVPQGSSLKAFTFAAVNMVAMLSMGLYRKDPATA